MVAHIKPFFRKDLFMREEASLSPAFGVTPGTSNASYPDITVATSTHSAENKVSAVVETTPLSKDVLQELVLIALLEDAAFASIDPETITELANKLASRIFDLTGAQKQPATKPSSPPSEYTDLVEYYKKVFERAENDPTPLSKQIELYKLSKEYQTIANTFKLDKPRYQVVTTDNSGPLSERTPFVD